MGTKVTLLTITILLSFFFVNVQSIFAIPFYVSIELGTDVPGCEMDNQCFRPSSDIEADVGTEIIWTNNDGPSHTITSGNPSDGPDGIFDSSMLASGDSFSFTFEEPGTYDYFCMVHPWMVGTIYVKDLSSNQSIEPTDSSETSSGTLFRQNEDVDKLLSEGNAASNEGRYEDAISYFKKALEIDPNHILVLYNIGYPLRSLGEYDEAIQYYKRALDVAPTFGYAVIAIGDTYMEQSKYDDAIQYYNKIYEVDHPETTDIVNALNGIGNAYFSQKNFEDAVTYYNKAREMCEVIQKYQCK